jgi:hypothetical protein
MSNTRSIAHLLGQNHDAIRMIDSSDVDDIVLNSQYLNGRNILDNGDMSIAQRTHGQDATGKTTGAIHQCDRWFNTITTAGTFTIQQDSGDHPNEFGESIKYDCTTANGSLGSSAELILYQKVEGQNVQHLAFGTASAKDVTLSFHVKSNLTGTLTAELYNIDPATNRHCSKTYTIDAANTWEYKTITYPGDTSQGFRNDNSVGLYMLLWLGAGSDKTSGTLQSSAFGDVTAANRVSSSQLNIASSTSNYIAFTGVQLEAGSKATPFERLPEATALANCQRYYFQIKAGANTYTQFCHGRAWGTGGGNGYLPFPVPMCKPPTMTASGVAADYDMNINVPASGSVPLDNSGMVINVTPTGSFTTGQTLVIGAGNAALNAAGLYFDADPTA